MPKIILRSNYLKDAPPMHLSNYVNYIGTRDGVEIIDKSKSLLPATVKQQQIIRQIIKDISTTKSMLEYADYVLNPTRENASEFISLALEQNLNLIGKRQNYVDYIANRPRVEKIGEHGLFTDAGTPIVLSQVQEEVANHKGVIWTHVVSLCREDAVRLGYDNGNAWQDLIRSKKAMLSQNMKIPSENLRWYCAMHNESHHPHIHLMVYSIMDNEGYLTENGIEAMRSELAHDIFRQDFAHIYEQQNQSRANLKQLAESSMRELLLKIQASTSINEVIEKDILLLSQRLKSTGGKKQYGYLKSDVKTIIDRIVDELAKEKSVAQAYGKWQEIQNEILHTYKDTLANSLPLSQQKEFKSIKNMVIKEALNIGNQAFTFEDEDMIENEIDPATQVTQNNPPRPDVETEEFDRNDEPPALDDIPLDNVEVYVEWTDTYKEAIIYLFGDNETHPDFEKAFKLLLSEAENGNALAMHDLGRMYADGLGLEIDTDMAQHWYAKALAAFRVVERETQKPYTEYRIGKMYNAGLGTDQDYEKAVRWFTPAAESKNKYAQYSLGGLYYNGKGVSQDYEKALNLYDESDEKNFPYSSYELAKMHRDGVGTTKNTGKADGHFKKAFIGFVALETQSHDDKLKYRIGQMLLTGTGTEKDIAEATGYFEMSARLGNSYAQYQLAKIYLADETADSAKIQDAIVWLTKAAEGENQFAQYALGKIYREGIHISKDEQKAIELFTLSAEQDNEYAAYALGKLYLKSEQLSKDVNQAVKWLTKSANLDNNLAQYTLGKLYLLGEDIPKDICKALDYLRKSAQQKNQFAQFQLGKIYLTGEDVAKDVKTAIRYLTDSAEQGNQFAQYTLGKLYLIGKDIATDKETALKWFALSAEQGNIYAQFFIDHMDDCKEPSVMLATTRLLHHLSNVFQDKTLPTASSHGIQIDRKQRRKMQEKKVAQGHAHDDNEQKQIM